MNISHGNKQNYAERSHDVRLEFISLPRAFPPLISVSFADITNVTLASSVLFMFFLQLAGDRLPSSERELRHFPSAACRSILATEHVLLPAMHADSRACSRLTPAVPEGHSWCPREAAKPRGYYLHKDRAILGLDRTYNWGK